MKNEQRAREMDGLQRRSGEVAVKNRMTSNSGKDVQHVGAATMSGALILKTVTTVAPPAAPQKTTLVGGGNAWNMMQGGAGSERQQGASEMNNSASGRGGSGSGLRNVLARPFPAAATSAPRMAPAAAAMVGPAPVPMRNCVTRFSYQSLSRATNNLDKRLGSGRFGSVFQGVLTSGTRVAVKRLNLEFGPVGGLPHMDQILQMQTEMQVLSQAQHPNIVQLLGSCMDEDSPCLVYPLMEGGSLQDRLACIQTGQVPLTATERMIVLFDVVRGLAFLHSEVKVIP